MRGSRIALALALLCSVAALAGCGVKNTIDPVAAAATKTENAGGAKMAMTVSASLPTGQSFAIDANGVFDKGQGDITMDMSSVLGAAGLSGGNGTVEMRYLQENGDPVIYMNMPFLSQMIPGGAKWIRLDLEQAGKGLGVDLNQLMGQANQNPASVLDMLRASGSVTEVGSETVNGESTTHYQASIDLSRAVDKLGPQAQAMVQHLIDQGAPASIPVDVWVGDDGLVRKLTMDESLTAGGQTTDVKLSMTISDYGTPVNVTAPPSGETVDLTQLATQAAQSAKSSSG
jgi:hypothetical protein